MKYILAHDLGTSGNKATLFSDEGKMITSEVFRYDCHYFNTNWAEQDPEDFWKAICVTSRNLIDKARIDPGDIAAVSFSGQMMGCLCVDKQGNPLRPSIIWADQRAQAQAAALGEQISLRGRSIAFCTGCLACQSAGQCVIQDDAVEIAEKMGVAEVIAFATPIYYYEMSGQMKTLLDRANALFASDYAFRDIYLLTSAAEEDDQVPARAESGLTGWIDCFEKARLAGTVFAGGVNGPGETVGHPALERARAMGRQV